MKSVIRSRMYSVFQNDVPSDRKQKCVENKRITTNTRFSQFSNLDQILFYVKFVHFYENNSLRSILHFTLDEKLPNSIYSKKKKERNLEKTFPFLYTSWTTYPESPCTRRNSAYVTRSNNVSNTSKRKRWSDRWRGRTSEVYNREDRVSEERARERESATTSADRFLRSRG